MIKVSSFGKFLDQPLLTTKLNKQIPAVLTAGSTVFIANEMRNAKSEDRKKIGLKLAIILGTTVLSAIQAPKIANFITKKKPSKTLKELIEYNSQTVDEILSTNNLSKEVQGLLEKGKTKILSLKEVDILHNNLKKEHFDKLIPPPENVTSKDIFREIGWLSIFGAVPVAGGIAGGIAADKLTEKNWKARVSNKIKEGVYQYLANIFLCNVGAGIALGILEKCNIKSKTARCAGMVGGILATGVIGGSAMANYISNKFLSREKKDIRTPEMLDLGLHTDDIATVSLLSGLKWIEPSLPVLYAISGYRAGIGYRNSDKRKNLNKNHLPNFLCNKC